MSRVRVRRAAISVVGVVSLALLATACPTPPPYGGPPTGNRSFSATSVTVNSVNDGWNITCFCYKDEPKVVNVGFRVKLGVPNSASSGFVAGSNHWDGIFEQGLAAGESYNYAGSEKGTFSFNNVALPDIGDLLQGAPIEIAGVWAWKLEDDGILAANVNNVANAITTALTSALNATVAQSQIPSDPNQIVNAVIAAIGNLGFLNLVATGATAILNNLNVLSDDVVGSAMYVGIGSSGTLGSIIDGTLGSVAFPAVPIGSIPVIGNIVVPPDIGGGAIFSLGTGTKTFTNNYTNGGVDGQHTTTYTFG